MTREGWGRIGVLEAELQEGGPMCVKGTNILMWGGGAPALEPLSRVLTPPRRPAPLDRVAVCVGGDMAAGEGQEDPPGFGS